MEKSDKNLDQTSVNPTPRKLEIADLDRPEMVSLVQNLIEHTATKGNIRAARIREKIKDGLATIHSKVNQVCPHLGKPPIWDKVMQRVYPAYTMKDLFEGNMRSVRRMVEQGQVFGIEVDGELVAISAYRKFGDNPDGREIYELTKASTLTQFRGRHFGDLINQEILKEISARSPEALITTVTANPGLKAKLMATGRVKEFSLLAPDHIAQLTRAKINDPDEVNRMEFEIGSRIYLYDPKAA